MSRPRKTLNRARVLAEALTMLDREGVEAFSMRRLAERLRVTPMALYNHVGDRDELLQAVAALVVDGIAWPEHDDWREQVRGCFRALRSACLAHPGAVPLIEAADELPVSIFRPMELILAALGRTGLGHADALRAYYLLTTFTLGQAGYQIRGWSRGVDAAAAVERARIDPAAFPHVSRVLSAAEWDFDASFEFGLSVILDGLGRRLSSARAPSAE